ncbi:hypothetical protein MPSYJ_07530 [Mycolicibacterium psychrotolerans]|uniref:Uncharacterized protein n=2 Tax=Mycolicibacterium psychrotolerans TaxID=216929 RepID=A0A7I7M601_9MYCO|nr:hypothetical protein [Mycolicibacterium psychrotolerans]BBX67292.1 hypothetical protein MPSYJ_07530 [Mycolicibacterium psychrotolerans]
MVVERGLARCPRCVSMADYAFIEGEPDGMRYEVRCRKCGERYEEDLRPVEPGKQLALIEPPILWPPDHEPVPPRDWRAEIRGHVSVVVQRSRAELDEMVRRTRTLAPKRRFGRQTADQTGG